MTSPEIFGNEQTTARTKLNTFSIMESENSRRTSMNIKLKICYSLRHFMRFWFQIILCESAELMHH